MKKLSKRFLALTLCLLMLAQWIPMPTMAAAAATPMSITVDSTVVRPGETIQINIYIANNPGITSLKLGVSYDEYLTLQNVVFNSDFGPYATTPKPYSNPQQLTLISPMADVKVNGVFATLTFAVSPDAPNAHKAEIALSYRASDIYNFNFEIVETSVENGYVTIYHGLPGDVNKDEKVNTKDAVALFRYVAGWQENVDEEALDVNGDGLIDTRDAVVLFRYVAGWPGIVLCRGKVCDHGSIIAVAAKDATCTEDGNIAYWYCADCAKYFSDADAATEIAYIDTVISATGHTPVVDEAVAPSYTQTGLTEGTHCGVCGDIITAQETIPMLQATYHAVIYRNLQGAESPAITQYAEHEGLAFEEVPAPVRLGYTFLGWYTASEGGTKVDMIEAGTTKNVTVYAHWKLKTYTITYKNAADNRKNPTEYNVESNIKLADPTWQGLKFSHWINEDGEVVSSLAKGTTGDIELEACWIDIKNYAVTSTNKDPVVVLKPNAEGNVDENGNPVDLYYIVYEVGTIYNVPMDYISTEYRYDGASVYSQEYSKTLNVGTQSATTATHTASSSYVQSHLFTNAVENIKEVSTTDHESFNLCPEIEAEGVKVKLFEYENGTSDTETNTRVDYTATEDGYSYGGDVTDEISSTISYYYDVSTTITETLTLSPDTSPAGGYRLAWVSDYKVYAIVVYNAKTGDYGLNIYNSALGTAKRTLYNLLPEYGLDVKIEKCNVLDYELPITPAEDYTGDTSCFAQNIVKASFYVEYDANGGVGTQMPLSVGNADGEITLLKNTYTKTGYHFTGWEYTDGTTVQQYTDMATITNPAANGATLVLKACWEKNTYKIQYNANKPSNASSSVLNVPGITDCTYDTAVTLGSAPSLAGWTFGGWYRDSACAVAVGNAGEVKENANLTAEQNATVTLYAKWTANTYNVTLNANGGTYQLNGSTLSTSTEAKTYNGNYGTLPTPTRSNCEFAGWYNGSTKVDSSTKITTVGNHTLAAHWTPYTSGYWSTGSRDQTVTTNGRTEYWQTGLNKDALKNAGYTQFTITIKINGIFDSGDWFKADWWFEIYAPSGEMVVEENEEHWKTSWSSREYTYTLSLDALYDDGTIRVWFDHGGDGADDFRLGTVEVWTTAK